MLSALYDGALDPAEISLYNRRSIFRETLLLEETDRRLSRDAAFMYAIGALSPDKSADSRQKILSAAIDQLITTRQPWVASSDAKTGKQVLGLDLKDPSSVERYYKAHVEHARKMREKRDNG